MSLQDYASPSVPDLIPAPIPLPPPEKWTEENIKILQELAAKALSASAIANELTSRTGETFTRNSIIGKLRRMQVALKGLPKFRKKAEQQPPKKRSVPILRPRPEDLMPLPFSSQIEEQPPLMLSIMEIEAGECRWPCTPHDSPQILFCGHSTGSHQQSWCAHHRRIGYVAPIKRWC